MQGQDIVHPAHLAYYSFKLHHRQGAGYGGDEQGRAAADLVDVGWLMGEVFHGGRCRSRTCDLLCVKQTL
jgi:hypothetical protein